MSNLRRRDFMGLLAAVAACGLPAPTAAPAAVAAPEPKRRLPDAIPSPRSCRPEWEKFVRDCLHDCVATRIEQNRSINGPSFTRITYRKMSPGDAKKCLLKKYRDRAERGGIRYCEITQGSPDPLDISLAGGLSRSFSTVREPITYVTIEWVHA